MRYQDGKLFPLIDGSGRLNRPTALALYHNQLFVTECSELVIYDSTNPQAAPNVVSFPAGEQGLNDLTLAQDKLYISSIPSNCIYELDLTQPELKPQLLAQLPGPNGLTVFEDTLYVVSIPSDFATIQPENVVYRLSLNSGQPSQAQPVSAQPLPVPPGLYDGAAISADGRTLYYSDWLREAVLALDLDTLQERTIFQEAGLTPADIALEGSTLFIPNIMHQEIILLNLQDNSVQRVK